MDELFITGFVAMKYRGAYNASKFALEGLVDTLRLEVINTNIYFSLIEPGPIRSNFRKNAFIMYKKNINLKKSIYKQTYLVIEERLQKEGDIAPFTLNADAVSKKVLLILKSKKPRARYYVTLPTYLFVFLKRILSTSCLDYFLGKF